MHILGVIIKFTDLWPDILTRHYVSTYSKMPFKYKLKFHETH